MHFVSMRSADKVGGQHFCSKCKGEVEDFTKRVDTEGLQLLFVDKVEEGPSREYFTTKMCPTRMLVKSTQCICNWLLWVSCIISLKVTDTSKIKTETIRMNDLAVFCLNDKAIRNGQMYCHPGMYVYDLWGGFNLCSASNS